MKLKELPVSAAYSLWLTIKAHRTHSEAQNCIVSLTSISERLGTLHLTIKSLLNQSTPPKKIILWLNHSLQADLPKALAELEGEQFKICYRDKTYSHRKLIYALKELAGEPIVTCDDDVMYRKNWLEALIDDHRKFPGAIICHECREISAGKEGSLGSYTSWPTINEPGYSSKQLLPIGYGGVLYPPNSLHPDTTNEDLYLALAPKADDLWFKAMSLLNGASVRRCSTPCKKPIPIIGAKGNSLAKTNIKEDGNRKQWLAICKHYGLNPCTLETIESTRY